MSPSSYHTTSTTSPAQHHPSSNDTSLSAILAASSSHHPNGHHTQSQYHHHHRHSSHSQQSMDQRQQDYTQSGLHSPYTVYTDHSSEQGTSAEHASATAQYQQNVKFDPDVSQPAIDMHNRVAIKTDLSRLVVQSARPSSFPDYIAQQPRSYPDQQRYQQPNAHPGHAAMAQASLSPSAIHAQHYNRYAPRSASISNPASSTDPSIAASSPTYPPHQQYSPYAPQDHMQYGAQPGAPMAYAAQPRPEWAGHYGPPPMYGHVQATAGGGAPGVMAQVAQRPPPVYYSYPGHGPAMSADPSRQGGHPLSTVYSFVPIPGAQQHKRPRRRYEEIERMYKCGWNGCEKAYGTLNHLNAHVTMQSHGSKRTPEGMHAIFFRSHLHLLNASNASETSSRRVYAEWMK